MKSAKFGLGLYFYIISAILGLAQTADQAIEVPVKFKAIGVTNYFGHQGPANGSITATLNGIAATADGYMTINTPLKTAMLEIGKPYGLVVNTSLLTGYKTVHISAPPGYVLTVDGIAKSGFKFSSSTAVYSIRIIPAESARVFPAGTASSLTGGQIKWNVALGSLLNGESAGMLSIVGAATSSWTAFYTPSTLYYESQSDEVYVYRVDGDIRQISAQESFIDVVTLDGTSYELRFYIPASAQGSTYPRRFPVFRL